MKYSRAGRILALGALLLAGGCREGLVSENSPRPQFTVGGEALLLCPGGDGHSAEAEIGVLGGLVGDGRHQLTLPLGAVSGTTKFRVTVPPSQYMEINIKANDREGFSFGEIVQAWISYARCDASTLPSTALVVWKIDPNTKALLKRMPSFDDRLNRRVIFETDSLSSYSIAH